MITVNPPRRVKGAILMSLLLLTAVSQSLRGEIDAVRSAIVRNDITNVATLLLAASESGDASASYRLSALYRLGLGVPKDLQRSLDLARAAHYRGDVRGTFMLAVLCPRLGCEDFSADWLAMAAREFAPAQRLHSAQPPLALTPTSESLAGDLLRGEPYQFLGSNFNSGMLETQDVLGRVPWDVAAGRGDPVLIARLLKATGESDVPDVAVSAAVLANDITTLNLLLAHGANVDASDSRGVPVLVRAIALKYDQIAATLVHRGANTNALVNEGTSVAFALARDQGKEKLMTSLLAHGARVRNQEYQYPLVATEQETKRFPNWQPLEIAAWQGQAERLTAILAIEGAGLSDQTFARSLANAAHAGCERCVSQLLTAREGALSSGDYVDQGALYWASTHQDGRLMVQRLLEAGANPNQHVGGRSALHGAIRSGAKDIVEILLQAGAELDVRDSKGRSPLSEAIRLEHYSIANALIMAGADPLQQDDDGGDALFMAVRNGSPALLQAMVTHVPAAGLQQYRWHELIKASLAGDCYACLQVFMEVEPAQRALNQSQGGNTALMVAAALAREQAIPTLLAHQPDLSVRNADGNTALMLAAMSGNREIVLQLLEAGADPLSRNARKMNARELAEAAGHSDVADLIEDYATNNRSWMRVITG